MAFWWFKEPKCLSLCQKLFSYSILRLISQCRFNQLIELKWNYCFLSHFTMSSFFPSPECEVIRWLPLSMNKNHLNGNAKTWQGSAIGGDSPKKIINKLYPPLTSCLKVRNMFDLSVEVGDGWKTVVRDAILEKVGVDHGIVHIVVDGQSKDGCVYVRLVMFKHLSSINFFHVK